MKPLKSVLSATASVLAHPGRDAFFVLYSLRWQGGLPTRLSQVQLLHTGKTKSSPGGCLESY